MDELQLGQLAVRDGILQQAQLTELLRIQGGDPSKPLGTLLVMSGFLTQIKLDALLQQLSANLDKPSNYSTEPRRDTMLGKEAVKRGWISQDQLHEGVREQGLGAARGEKKRLGEVLVEKRLLTAAQVAELLKRQGKCLLSCPACGKRYNLAKGDPAKTVLCPNCKVAMRLEATTEKVDVEATVFGSREEVLQAAAALAPQTPESPATPVAANAEPAVHAPPPIPAAPAMPAPVAATAVPAVHAPPPIPAAPAMPAPMAATAVPAVHAPPPLPARPTAPATPAAPAKPAAHPPAAAVPVRAGVPVASAAPAPHAPHAPAAAHPRRARPESIAESRRPGSRERLRPVKPGVSRSLKIILAAGVGCAFLVGALYGIVGSGGKSAAKKGSGASGLVDEQALAADLEALENSARSPGLDASAFREKCTAFAERAKDTPYARRALALADGIGNAAAVRSFDGLVKEVNAGIESGNFDVARRKLTELKALPLGTGNAPDPRSDLEREFAQAASRAFPNLMKQANGLAAEGRYEEAEDLLYPVREWGLAELHESVEGALAQFAEMRKRPPGDHGPSPTPAGDDTANKTGDPGGPGPSAEEQAGEEMARDSYEAILREVAELEEAGKFRRAADRCGEVPPGLAGTRYAKMLAERRSALERLAVAAEGAPKRPATAGNKPNTAGSQPGTSSLLESGTPCVLCLGKKIIHCGTCGGRPAGDIPCPRCVKGKKPCSACGGAGAFECTACTSPTGELRKPKSATTMDKSRRLEDPCKLCGDKRVIPCILCRGSGSENCGSCGGKGRIRATCPDCRGASSLACPLCVPPPDTCPECGGKRERACAACDGKKKSALACKTCQGTKLILCGACQAGRVMCADCKGAGAVHTVERVDGGYNPLTGKGGGGGMSNVKKHCKSCDQKGWATCGACKGKGVLACPDCASGAPETDCWWCQGKGVAPCGRCGTASGLCGESRDGLVQVIAAPLSDAWPALTRARTGIFANQMPRGICFSVRLRAGAPPLFFAKSSFQLSDEDGHAVAPMAVAADIAPVGSTEGVGPLLPYLAVDPNWFSDMVSLNPGQRTVLVVLFDRDEDKTLFGCASIKLGTIEVPLSPANLGPAEVAMTQPAGGR